MHSNNKGQKGQTTIYKTLHRKQNIEQNEHVLFVLRKSLLDTRSGIFIKTLLSLLSIERYFVDS